MFLQVRRASLVKEELSSSSGSEDSFVGINWLGEGSSRETLDCVSRSGSSSDEVQFKVTGLVSLTW